MVSHLCARNEICEEMPMIAEVGVYPRESRKEPIQYQFCR
jgi:hypothetical protein